MSYDAPFAGLKFVMRGPTVKLPVLVAVPAGVVTVILPVVAFAGTVVTICVLECAGRGAVVPLNFTDVAPPKPVPSIVTEAPTAPNVGVKPVMLGLTVNVPTLVAEGTLLRDRWLTAPEATLDVHAASVRYTLRAVGRMLFGADLDPLLPAFGPAFAQLNVHLRQRLTASLLAPRSWPTPGNLRGRKAQRSLYGMVDAIISDRQTAGRSEDDLHGTPKPARA